MEPKNRNAWALLRDFLNRLDPFGNGLMPIPVFAGMGIPGQTVLPERSGIEFFAAGGGSDPNMELLESGLTFVLHLRKLCEMYLNATTKALEFPYLGKKTMIIRDQNDLFKYSDDWDTFFAAAFNTVSELISRDTVYKRLGLRLSTEEFADLPPLDCSSKLLRKIAMIYQILCSSQSAFKNLRMPGKMESALG